MRKQARHLFDFDGVVAAMNRGERAKVVAERFGVAPTTVYKADAEAHPERPRKPKAPRADDARVLTLYRRKKKRAEIAKTVGVCASTVYRVLKRHGIVLDPTPDRVLLNGNQIAEAYKARATLQQLADENKVSRRTIATRIQREGGTTRNREQKLNTAKLVRQYNAGTSASALARANKTTPETIMRRLVAAGVRMRSRKEATSGKRTGALTWHQQARTVQVKTDTGWERLAELVWKKAHGPIPADCVLRRIDTKVPPKRIDRIDNLAVVGRGTNIGVRWAKGRIDLDRQNAGERRELLTCILIIAALKTGDTSFRLGKENK